MYIRYIFTLKIPIRRTRVIKFYSRHFLRSYNHVCIALCGFLFLAADETDFSRVYSDDVDIREPSWGHVFNIAKHVAKAALGRSRKEYACSRKSTFANRRSLLRSQQVFLISEHAAKSDCMGSDSVL